MANFRSLPRPPGTPAKHARRRHRQATRPARNPLKALTEEQREFLERYGFDELLFENWRKDAALGTG